MQELKQSMETEKLVSEKTPRLNFPLHDFYMYKICTVTMVRFKNFFLVMICSMHL